MNRRTLLRRGLLAGAVGLAGCAGGGDGGDGGGDGGSDDTTTTEETTTTTTEDGDDGDDTTTTTEEGGMDTTTTEDGGDGDTTTTTTEDTTTTTTAESEARSSVEVTVAPDGSLRFAPDSFTLQAGGTVTWVWAGSGHNVSPESQPSGADWSGSPGAPQQTLNSGATYEHTFDVPGEYAYFCNPHKSFGMEASFTVVE